MNRSRKLIFAGDDPEILEWRRRYGGGTPQGEQQQMMGDYLGDYRGTQILEKDVMELFGFIALDGSSNVVGIAPTATPPAAQSSGPYAYTRFKGLTGSIGVAGAVVTQPHQSAGLYYFTLDKPWEALLDASLTFYDQGAVTGLQWSVTANVRANTSDPAPISGVFPGTNTNLSSTPTNQVIIVRFRTSAAGGALTDPVASTGWWMKLNLKRTKVWA